MRIQELNGKNICLIGFGREGHAMQKALTHYAPKASITVADANASVTAPGATLKLGANYLKGLNAFDVIIRSSGIKDTPELNAVAAKTTDMTRIFFDTIAGSRVNLVGVTGSKGKSTTSNLIYTALKAADPRTFLMGNIGTPMISFIEEAKKGTTFVIELSSYMLEHLKRSPQIAVITSFFPEHLDRHGSVDKYWEAKKSIAAHQNVDDVVFYNAAYPECEKLASLSPGKKIPFTANDFPLPVGVTKLTGEHNRSNLAAAFKVATYLGIPEETALTALKNAQPLPHRLQNLGNHGGVNWVNDSFATAPNATIAALKALPEVTTLIVGGFDRGVDYSELAACLAASPVQNIIIFPPSGQKIRALVAEKANKNFYETSNMADAVAWAAEHTPAGKTCLLSPASPSFGIFTDFVERGEAFIKAVNAIDKLSSKL